MTDRPILFSAQMVRALLAGTKTQTRRILGGLGDQPIVEYDGMFMWKHGFRWGAVTNPKFPPGVRFTVGDRLYVREAWRTSSLLDADPPRSLSGVRVWYEADTGYKPQSRFRQGMHMPRWASRLTLEVTEVRIQRLQEISEADAQAEGVVPRWRDGVPIQHDGTGGICIEAYRALWDSLNADRGYGWDTNPWVVAVSFSVERRNIDA